jgi:hypothetical protein
VALPRSEQGRPGLLRLLPGTNSGQPQLFRRSQPQNLKKPGTSGAQRKVKERTNHEPSSTGPESSESKGHLKGPGKQQRPFGVTPEGGQVKRPKQVGQPIYARAAWECIQMGIVCEGYPGVQISRGKFVGTWRTISALVDGHPEQGLTPRLVDSY